MSLVEQTIATIAAHFQEYNQKVVIAYSGGLDSTVLLHLFHQYCTNNDSKGFKWCAAHVNHQYHPLADRWEEHCQNDCKRQNIPLQICRITIPQAPKKGLEEAFRMARYQALREILQAEDYLLTAHHQNDQAETVLLRLLRGAGVKGLGAIQETRLLDGIHLFRPLLHWSRHEIHLYAQKHRLHWIEDFSNSNTVHDRNYLRHCVVPTLSKRWPQWDQALSRSAQNHQEANLLLEQLADDLLSSCSQRFEALDLPALLCLSIVQQKLVLRRWLEQHQCLLPSTKKMNVFVCELNSNSADKVVMHCRDFQVRRYRNELYYLDTNNIHQKEVLENCEWKWKAGEDLFLEVTQQYLFWDKLCERSQELAKQGVLVVRFRRGGERYRRCDKEQVFHQPLKKWFQARGVPPWQRASVPLIFVEKELRLVWD